MASLPDGFPAAPTRKLPCRLPAAMADGCDKPAPKRVPGLPSEPLQEIRIPTPARTVSRKASKRRLRNHNPGAETVNLLDHAPPEHSVEKMLLLSKSSPAFYALHAHPSETGHEGACE